MRSLSTAFKLALVSSLAGFATGAQDGLRYGSDGGDANERQLSMYDGGLKGCWSSFSQSGYCLEKVFDELDATSEKVKFRPCDDMKPSQMWKFMNDDNNPAAYPYGGIVYNMDGGCLGIRGDYERGKNLKVLPCNPNNGKQKWLSDGDSLRPKNRRAMCVGPVDMDPIKDRDPVVLVNCDDAYSLDY